ncbi:MAG: hypothetical protein M3032_03605 [Verrucomicrobiota bacterium]|nr:hypothetical protein [Verrucomicrobiota bacterium]
MLSQLKRAARSAIEARVLRSATSEFGLVVGNDIRRLLRHREQPQIMDVGANAGQWLRSIKSEFPKARVVC